MATYRDAFRVMTLFSLLPEREYRPQETIYRNAVSKSLHRETRLRMPELIQSKNCSTYVPTRKFGPMEIGERSSAMVSMK